MLLSKVLGVIVIARNGDRYNYYQDPVTYAGSNTETTALGVVRLIFLSPCHYHSLIRFSVRVPPPRSFPQVDLPR